MAATILIVCTITEVRTKSIVNASYASRCYVTPLPVAFEPAPVSAVFTFEDLPAPNEVFLFVVRISGLVLLYQVLDVLYQVRVVLYHVQVVLYQVEVASYSARIHRFPVELPRSSRRFCIDFSAASDSDQQILTVLMLEPLGWFKTDCIRCSFRF